MVGKVWLERQVCEGDQKAVFLLLHFVQLLFLQVNLEKNDNKRDGVENNQQSGKEQKEKKYMLGKKKKEEKKTTPEEEELVSETVVVLGRDKLQFLIAE